MDHRQAMYIGLRLPKRPKRPVKKSRSKKQSDKTSSSNGTIPTTGKKEICFDFCCHWSSL